MSNLEGYIAAVMLGAGMIIVDDLAYEIALILAVLVALWWHHRQMGEIEKGVSEDMDYVVVHDEETGNVAAMACGQETHDKHEIERALTSVLEKFN